MRNLPTFDLGKIEKPKFQLESDEGFHVHMRKGSERIEIAVLEDIGDDGWGGGVRAADIKSALNQSPTSPVTVSINSPGGLAYEGMAIYNALAAHQGDVTTVNEGLAYSAASIIFMAGDKRKVHESSHFGIHRSRGGGFGTSTTVMAVAEFLDKLDDLAIDLYARRTGQSVEQITNFIDGTSNGEMGTMFSASEAVAASFATEILSDTAAPVNKQTQAVQKADERGRASLLPVALQARREMIDTLTGKV